MTIKILGWIGVLSLAVALAFSLYVMTVNSARSKAALTALVASLISLAAGLAIMFLSSTFRS